MITAVALVYVLTTLGLATYAAMEARILWIHFRTRQAKVSAHKRTGDLPFVTVQLPLYNERTTARRLLEAVMKLKYPKDLIELHILDDSTDETREIVDEAAAEARVLGFACEVFRRPSRDGFKAGALSAAFGRARGSLIAMFDADFVPPPDFLQRLLVDADPFVDPNVGFVQTRWVHLNRDASWFTRAQALLIDRHFTLEKPARQRAGFVTTFNGSGGIWRKSAIEQAGGWQPDTLTEDLDLSFRLVNAGFRGAYVRDMLVGAELPEGTLAFKVQQRRWAIGSIQCLKRLGATVLRSPKYRYRGAELLLLGSYLIHPMVLGNLLIWPFAVFYLQDEWFFWAGQAVVTLASFVAPLGFTMTVVARGDRVSFTTAREVLVAMALGFGLMVTGVAGAFAGAVSGTRRTPYAFERTPKRGTETSATGGYRRAPLPVSLWGEIAVASYCLLSAAYLIAAGKALFVGLLLVWAGCLIWIASRQLSEALRERADPLSGAALLSR